MIGEKASIFQYLTMFFQGKSIKLTGIPATIELYEPQFSFYVCLPSLQKNEMQTPIFALVTDLVQDGDGEVPLGSQVHYLDD